MASGDAAEVNLKPLVFRLHESTPSVVRDVLLEHGWVDYAEQEQDEGDWNLYWRVSDFRKTEYENIMPWQRLNHHPKTFGITRKDNLARNLKRMKGIYGTAVYDFSPVAFIMPNDYTKFITEYTKDKQANGGKPSYWICKPVDLSRGRGIFLFQDIKDLTYDCSVIVQKYIANPLLISGYKFDLRIYVCVTSFHPLTVYIYQEGLVRFATEKFNLNSLDNIYAHLTNTSINKFGPSYTTNKERVGSGCKWTLSQFRCYLHSLNIDELLLWQRINNIVTTTLLTIAPSLPPTPNCFELFGFDILIDEKIKPWLLEVNYSPALSLDCSKDVTVKKELITDLIELLNYKSIDTLRRNGYIKQTGNKARSLSNFPLCNEFDSALPFLPKSLQRDLGLLKLTDSYNPQNSQLPSSRSSSQSSLCNQSYSSEEHCSEEEKISGSKNNSAWNGRSQILFPSCTEEVNTSNINGQDLKCIDFPSKALLGQWEDQSSVKEGMVNEMPTRNPAKKTSATRLHMPKLHLQSCTLSRSKKIVPLRQNVQSSFKLPSLHAGKFKNATSSQPFHSTIDKRPLPRVGDFILTFPFNEATRIASQGSIDVKKIIQEVHKVTRRVLSPDHRKVKRRKDDFYADAIYNRNYTGHLIWGPQYPPLLSDCCSKT
ncbi:probable tubulin polyglutamylase TTLL2 [Latimeria chalumnae]|uniref:probable tubulin polyglutamylase TTLL2 n=1 Tax=Latimeria chalumnae TaxID=7897 RepID=UPI0003C159EB|nr:PREDICTED: probable tubulin polyglutamylase TTLL2 [Latimeria chalumnae]XP_014344855.1 PREDICTED: probable tubulin polyglutamylase TTLL2 [Latimeria chalumnae]|eukprot:XP_005997625.1 PREDICTED: probable tubulin polyglutamylase TTLL2 [Latimeria chalumnae]